MVVAFSSLNDAMKVLYGEVKFVRPSKPIQWDSKIHECVFTCKVLKTLAERFSAEKKDYKFIWIHKTLWNPTTFKVSYLKDSYTFEIKCGVGFSDNTFEIKDRPVNLYDYAEKLLDRLVRQAKDDLPSSHYESLVKRCNELKALKNL
jgi:hypothetical protein